jgi:MoxR-like ATPase
LIVSLRIASDILDWRTRSRSSPTSSSQLITMVTSVVELPELMSMQEAIKQVFVSQPSNATVVELSRATGKNADVYSAPARAAAWSFTRSPGPRGDPGRDYVPPDDKALAEFVSPTES